MNQTIAHSQLNTPYATPGLVQCLSDFRERLEFELDGPLEELTAPAVLILNDLCFHLELSDAERETVLGSRGVAAVERIFLQTVTKLEPEDSVADTSGPVH